MKKILSTLLLILPLAVFADDFGLIEPVWKDFAPSAFTNVGEPKGIGKLNVTAKYWFQRRVDFERELAECKEFLTYEERYSCYEELKVRQFQKNTEYNAKIEAKYQSMYGIPEMQNRTDTMVPINNYINSFSRYIPNEIR